MNAQGPVSMAMDVELPIQPSIRLALIALLVAQIPVFALSLTSIDSWAYYASIVGLEALGLHAAYRFLVPPQRLYFNGRRLMVCARNGRKRAVIERFHGFAAPFFISIQSKGRVSIGVFSLQLNTDNFGKLLCWAKGNAGN